MKKIFLGIGIGVAISVCTSVYAAESIQALLFPIKIKINGEIRNMESEYQILNVDGHAYVPIRYIAENTGINIGYDDASQTILLAYNTEPVEDEGNQLISVSDVITTSYDKNLNSTHVTGHLFLHSPDAKYVYALLEFYNSSDELIGTSAIDDDFHPGQSLFDIRGEKDLTGGDIHIKLKVREVHPALKSTINELFVAAQASNLSQVQSTLHSLSDDTTKYLLLDFMKWSVPYDGQLRTTLFNMILSKNPNINQQDNGTGYTPLLYACNFAIDEVKPLVEAGADVNVKARDGSTPLLMVASKKAPDTVKLLLEKKANPNVVGGNHTTPLLSALRPMFENYTSETVATVKYLLEAGANVNVTDESGNNPLQLTENVPDSDVKEQLQALLRSHGAQ